MTRLYLDIEAIPQEKESVRQPTFKEKLLRKKTKKPAQLTQQIICIGYAVDDEPVQIFSGDEVQLLKSFWDLAKKTNLYVGFGIFDYDLKLIWQRSIIHGIRPSVEIVFDKGTSAPIYDIAYEWSKWTGGIGSKISLENLAKLLKLPSPKNGEVNGQTVSKAYYEGKIQEINEYCMRDVKITREIYKKLTFLGS